MNNTYKHISAESKFSDFDPAGTNFPSTVTNVQDALAMLAPTSQATETQVGVMAIASQAETDAGLNNTKAVTPLTLSKRLLKPEATTTTPGIMALATNAEANAGTVTNKAIVPSSLKYTLNWYFTNKVASETALGVIKIANLASATAGTDDTTAMTPLKVKQAIAAATAQIPSYTTATESAPGIVQLATVGQASIGTIREGFAISPYTLAQLTGNLTRKGIVQAATQVQATAGTDDGLYISAKGFKTYVATATSAGTVKLSDTVKTGAGLALSANAKVLPTTGGTVTGTLAVDGNLTLNGSEVASHAYVESSVPIGCTQMWMGTAKPAGGLWELCDGGQESKAARPDLFAVIGYTFGGSGDVFYRPDMRGLFVRGAGIGKDISDATGFDSFNKPLLGNDVSGGAVGEVQAQQVKTHKHVMPWGESYGAGAFGATVGSKFLGSGKTDSNNPMFFSNDGTEVDSASIRSETSTLNSEDLMGVETRPWNMSVNYIIKVA